MMVIDEPSLIHASSYSYQRPRVKELPIQTNPYEQTFRGTEGVFRKQTKQPRQSRTKEFYRNEQFQTHNINSSLPDDPNFVLSGSFGTRIEVKQFHNNPRSQIEYGNFQTRETPLPPQDKLIRSISLRSENQIKPPPQLQQMRRVDLVTRLNEERKETMFQIQLRRATEMSQVTLKNMRKRRKFLDVNNSIDLGKDPLKLRERNL